MKINWRGLYLFSFYFLPKSLDSGCDNGEVVVLKWLRGRQDVELVMIVLTGWWSISNGFGSRCWPALWRLDVLTGPRDQSGQSCTSHDKQPILGPQSRLAQSANTRCHLNSPAHSPGYQIVTPVVTAGRRFQSKFSSPSGQVQLQWEDLRVSVSG